MRLDYKKIGKFIRQVGTKNTDLTVTDLKGISINKEFMPSVANVIGTDLSKYRVVEKEQFAFNPMHVGRDKVLPISMLETDEKVIISPAYVVFEIIDKNELNPEYLMMWCRRPEFDRNAWFTTDSSVRGGFSWTDFCEMELPVPSIEKQREIVKEYNTIANRIKLNEQLNQKLEQTAQAIYKQWFVDFEFPDENNRPYKSLGGAMEYCEELGREIPKEWKVKNLSDVTKIRAGGDKPKAFSLNKNVEHPVPIYSNGVTNNGLYGYTNKHNYPKNSITISARGTIGFCVLRREDFEAIVRLLVLTPNFPHSAIYLWQTIRNIEFDDSGSVQSQLTVPQMAAMRVIMPAMDILEKYNSNLNAVFMKIEAHSAESKKLHEMQELLLSCMASKQQEVVAV